METAVPPTDGDALQQNATLPAQQARAVVGLLGGLSITEAAKVAGVNRATVHRWLKDDFSFQAAVNRGRRELREALQSRLMNLAEDAISCLEQAVQAGDGKTALALLKGLGFLGGKPISIPSGDPDELRDQHEEQVARRKLLSVRR